MKSVNQIMIEGDDLEVGSESDVSDTSQISTYLILILYSVHSVEIKDFTVAQNWFQFHVKSKLQENLGNFHTE